MKLHRNAKSTLDVDDHRMIVQSPGNAEYIAPGYLLFIRDAVLYAQRFDLSRLRRNRREGDDRRGGVDHLPIPCFLLDHFRDGLRGTSRRSRRLRMVGMTPRPP